MLRRLRHKKAQANMGEYALVLIITISFISAVSLYVRRALQSRLFDARNLLMHADCFGCLPSSSLKSNPSTNMLGNIDISYEPYYTVTSSKRYASYDGEANLVTDGTGTSFQRKFDSAGDYSSLGITLPPSASGNPAHIEPYINIIKEKTSVLHNTVFI
nr:hypothetical protein [Candidatus Omnitrophota bacterium]